MELPSASSSPPQRSSTRRVRSPFVNSRTALSISRSGFVWPRASRKEISVPSASVASAPRHHDRQQVDQVHLQFLRGDVQEHRADDLPVGIRPRHADGDHLVAQLGEQAGDADFLPLLDDLQLLGHGRVEDVFRGVPAAVEHLRDAGIVADDPDVGVVPVVDVGDLAAQDELHGHVVAHGAQLVQVGHVVGDLVRLQPHLVFVTFLTNLLQQRRHDAREHHDGREASRP